MTKHSMAKFCILAASILGLASQAYAGKEVFDAKKEIVEKVKESCITGDIGFNVTNQYISRGLIFENQGFIIQPYADLYFRLYQGDGFLSKVTLNLGIWDTFHSRHTDAGLVSGTPGVSSTRAWYESDFTAGISFTFAKVLTLTPSYYAFLSPNDGFNTFQGLNVNLALDDSTLLGPFALHPHVTVLFELENKAGSGKDEGVYYEVGVAPALPALGPLTVTLPITAGFGTNQFYFENQGFGFFSAGVNASVALKFIPECYGTWAVNTAATYYYLGESLSSFNTAPLGGDIRDRENSEWIFSGGLSVAF